jgi:tRNA 2-selenouridine synthase
MNKNLVLCSTFQFQMYQAFQPDPDFVLLDVRSPGEYSRGHIPGAISFPLFSDEERAVVGTIYKQQGKDEAVLEGLRIVGPKMAGFVEEAARLSPNKKVMLQCWRGGMRSASVAWLLQQAGFETRLIKGGYKSYRNEIHQYLNQAFPFIVITGPTGSKKTKILQALRDKGEQVIDLEALANHKGSAFGALGMAPQPSIEQFENLLHVELLAMDFSRRIWIEDESRKIGTVVVHEPFWKHIKSVPVVLVNLSIQERIQFLVDEYGDFPAEKLEESILKIAKRLGGQHVKAALEALELGDLAQVASITLNYYDKAYLYALENRGANILHRLDIDRLSYDEIAEKIIQVSNA